MEFLNRYLPAKPRKIITPEGKILGDHVGLMHYTIGQRKGSGIGITKDGSGEPWFEADKDLERNELIVVLAGDYERFYSKALAADNFNFINKREFLLKCNAKFRYRQMWGS